MENVVELKNVTKAFKGFSVKNMDLQVKKGFVTVCIGANGAGKSTTIKLMMNLLKPDAGEVKLFGLDYKTHEKAIKERIGFVYDGNVFFEGLNLKDIKRIVSPAYKNWDDVIFSEYIDKFQLPLHKAIKTFSKGMQMKASLAIALSHHAELIIMDEPTVGIDPQSRNYILETVKRLNKEKKMTVLYTSHYMEEVEFFCNRIYIMDKGNNLAAGTKEEI